MNISFNSCGFLTLSSLDISLIVFGRITSYKDKDGNSGSSFNITTNQAKLIFREKEKELDAEEVSDEVPDGFNLKNLSWKDSLIILP